MSWDSLAPLSLQERQSIHLIQKAVDDRPLPSALRPSLALSTPPTRASSPLSNPLRRLFHQQQQPLQNHSSHQDQQPIASIDRFNDWFSGISSQIEADAEADYLNHLAVLSTYSAACDSLDRVIDDCRGLLNEVDANWRFVSENARSIERSCEAMLNDQKLLSGIASALNHRLEYFRKLDYAQKVLSRPGQAQIVNDPEFLPMMARLDVCLEFIKSHRHLRDADLYLVRFQQCLTRSMTLIKLHYTNQIQTLGKQVNDKIQQINQRSTTSTNNLNIEEGLLYEKFEQLSDELRPLITQVEKRFEFDRLEYGDLLNEFFRTWFSVRNMLLNPRIKLEIHRIQITHEQVPDLVSLTTTGCNYLRSICAAEWKLFKSFFPRTGEEELFTYLESLSDYLYDLLRPQILHEHKLDLLCDLATIMNALIAIDSELMNESDRERDPSSRFKFSSLLRPILQDIQTRLIFRAQALIQSDVENYQPRPGDLDYPNKLVKSSPLDRKSSLPDHPSSGIKNPNPSISHSSNLPLKLRLPDQDVQETWYPTLRKTLWILSNLHTYVNDAIFEDFAGEAVGICSESIIKASTFMTASKPRQEANTSTTSKPIAEESEWTIDRELFVIRHLLILKEMIRTLEVVQVERAVDLGPITDVLKEILNPSLRDSLIFRPVTLLNKLKNLHANNKQPVFLATDHPLLPEDPRSTLVKTIDSKSELDLKLKMICSSFIRKSCALMTADSIDSFLGRCTQVLNLAPVDPRPSSPVAVSLLGLDWCGRQSVLDTFRRFLSHLHSGLRLILNRLDLYFPTSSHQPSHLVDFNLANVLFPSLQDEILDRYTQFFNLIKSQLADLNLIKQVGNHGKDVQREQELELVDLAQLSTADHVLHPVQIKSLIQHIVYLMHS